jgi:hypothetical protein
MLTDYYLGSTADGIVVSGTFLGLVWMFLCGVYAILLFCIPFILYGIMKNTKQTADLLAEMRSLPRSSDPSFPRSPAPPAAPKRALYHLLQENEDQT